MSEQKAEPTSQSGPQTSMSPKTAFEQAGQEESPSLAREFWLFITENKKWWMIPIMVVLSLVGLLALLASTGAAPFIYTLF